MYELLSKTAWPMEIPLPYSPFHFIIFGLCLATAIFAAFLLRKKKSPTSVTRILLITGLILLFGELYKQAFCFIYLRAYDYMYWIVPFQLCSIPMYLCLALPFIRKESLRKIILTFLTDFGLLGAIGTMVDPSGIFHGFWALTMHGILWHAILVFIAAFILFTGSFDHSKSAYFRTLPLFAICCLIAEIINVCLHRFGEINMFYISPYEMSTQLVFSDIDHWLGRPLGIAIYLVCVIIGGGMIHLVVSKGKIE